MASYDTWVISAIIILVCIAIAGIFVIYNKIKERKAEDTAENDEK